MYLVCDVVIFVLVHAYGYSSVASAVIFFHSGMLSFLMCDVCCSGVAEPVHKDVHGSWTVLCTGRDSKGTLPLAGCKGGTLRRIDRWIADYPMDDVLCGYQGVVLRCAEAEGLAGGSKGAKPTGKFNGIGKPGGFSDGVVRYGLP